DLERAQAREVLRQELRVEDDESPRAQTLDERRETHLGRIGGTMKHRLAHERPAERHAVEAADQETILIRLDAVREAARVQLAVDPLDLGRDPGVGLRSAGAY